MPEIDREDLLAQRAEEKRTFEESARLNQLVMQQATGDTVSSAAKRKHTQRGATKTKMDKLAELKARRKAKDDRKKTGKDKASPKRGGSVSSNDMEISSDEEDGEINKDEQLEERVRNTFEKPEVQEQITIADIQPLLLTRDLIAKHYVRPWFEEYVKGCFVRFLIGNENREPVYRLCEVTNLGAEICKPYKVNEQLVNQVFELKHGKYIKLFPMDKVSNTTVTQREFDRLVRVSLHEKTPLPTKRQLEKKKAHIAHLTTQAMTEAELAAMLARRNAIQPNRVSRQQALQERSRLQQERSLAIRREDFQEAAQLEAKLKELDEAAASEAPTAPKQPDVNDIFAKINEKNRQRNLEAIRKAEAEQAIKKRLERKALASGSGTLTPVDPSARVRTVPKLFKDRASRGGTPSGALTPNLTPPTKPADGAERSSRSPIPPLSMPPAASTAKKTDFETSMMNIEIDLGDF